MSRKTLSKTYGDMKPVGTYSICNTCGMLVFEPTKEDSYDYDFITAIGSKEP